MDAKKIRDIEGTMNEVINGEDMMSHIRMNRIVDQNVKSTLSTRRHRRRNPLQLWPLGGIWRYRQHRRCCGVSSGWSPLLLVTSGVEEFLACERAWRAGTKVSNNQKDTGRRKGGIRCVESELSMHDNAWISMLQTEHPLVI